MENLIFNLQEKAGKFKILNATNGGPWHKRHANDQYRSTFEDYKKARMPYSRNHDSSFFDICGGQYAHDITAIFPNFDADPTDPNSYDFACTDESILVTLDAGTQTFFRLGQRIEHEIKKHGTLPPKDFKKWAVICEHIIRHYNYGWADGFHLNIEYWEIWNEPDLDDDDSTDKKTWGGTKAQFFDLYEIAAKHLKSNFPELKIGGPALAGREDWAEDFLREMQKRNVPIDFFSWHVYSSQPQIFTEQAVKIKALLDTYGYSNAESILNEWNYVKGWTDEFVYTLEMIHGIKGAAFIMAVISQSQQDPIDMLMYYDTLPSVFCGTFDLYTFRPLKGYYPLYWYGMFYDMEAEIKCSTKAEDLYTLCGIDKNNKTLTVLTYYTDDDNAASKDVHVDFGKDGLYEIYLLDKNTDAQLVQTTSDLTFTMDANSCLLIKEI